MKEESHNIFIDQSFLYIRDDPHTNLVTSFWFGEHYFSLLMNSRAVYDVK